MDLPIENIEIQCHNALLQDTAVCYKILIDQEPSCVGARLPYEIWGTKAFKKSLQYAI